MPYVPAHVGAHEVYSHLSNQILLVIFGSDLCEILSLRQYKKLVRLRTQLTRFTVEWLALSALTREKSVAGPIC